ncbi:MAG: deoxyribonuclease IV [Candidatus Odinarchaeota archaeon]|nr:deoxyribonuclease IV [Candidatus Odinarchaeota archaeon]
MGILGAHISIAGGISKAPIRGREIGCDAIQIFTKSQRQWKAKPLTEEEIEAFKKNMKDNNIKIAVAHDSYLINLGSPDEERYKKSLESFIDEVIRAGLLGIPYLVFHPGAHMNAGEEFALKRIAESLNEVIAKTEEYPVVLLLETTAGQGSNVGYKFEHIAEIIDMVDEKKRVGACFDTAHIFAAGYDIRTREAYEETIDLFDEIIGLDKLKVIHLNDSKKELGSRVDRHEHIGKGLIGIDAFKFIVNDKRFEKHPMILETPGAEKYYKENLEVLRSLIEK